MPVVVQVVKRIPNALQEHVHLHTAIQVVQVPAPQFQSSTSISSAVPSAALPPGTEYNASTPARAWESIAASWCSSVKKTDYGCLDSVRPLSARP